MRLLLCTFAVSVIFSAASLPRAQSLQQLSQSPPTTTPVKDPCPNSVMPDDKKACWKELARRADFLLNPDPCEDESHRSDEDRDNCKMDRAKEATGHVDEYYQAIQKALHADSSKGKSSQWDDTGLLTELRNTQAAWARYRDLQCEAETTPYDGGTVTISIKAGCQREKGESRLKELQLTYARYVHTPK